MRSLYDPVGLAASSFTHTSAMSGSTRWVRRTAGVSPIAASTPSDTAQTLDVRPAQYGARSSRLRILPDPVLGSSSSQEIERGTL